MYTVHQLVKAGSNPHYLAADCVSCVGHKRAIIAHGLMDGRIDEWIHNIIACMPLYGINKAIYYAFSLQTFARHTIVSVSSVCLHVRLGLQID